MAYTHNSPADAPQRTPYQFALFLFLSIVIAWTALRALLIYRFVPAPHFTRELGELLLHGFKLDAFVALILVVPVLGWFLIVPQRWYIERWQRFFFWFIASVVALVHVTLMLAEYYYFSEFSRRFDAAALQLALHPDQGELLLPKHASWWLGGCAAAAGLFVIVTKRRYASMWLTTASLWKRIGLVVVALGLIAGLYYLIERGAPLARKDRMQLEIADNGLLTLARAAWSCQSHDGELKTAAGWQMPPVELQPEPLLGVTGTVQTHDAFPSTLVDARNVHVWLPPSYATDAGRHYPVIYANDGQNQFDPKLSFIGTDWALDETMTRLIEEKKVREAIIVAVWNTPKRTMEYVPQKAVLSSLRTWREPAMRQLLKNQEIRLEDPSWQLSGNYLKFLVTELKPFIDQQYRTLTNRDDTFIMGSSAGAMISLYAVSEYPQVFGGAACLSTHWPMGDGVLVEYFRHKLADPATHRIYFDFGTATLDKTYEPYQLKMDAAMEARGYQAGTNWLTYKFAGAEHSEKDWCKRVHVPLTFLLGKPAENQ